MSPSSSPGLPVLGWGGARNRDEKSVSTQNRSISTKMGGGVGTYLCSPSITPSDLPHTTHFLPHPAPSTSLLVRATISTTFSFPSLSALVLTSRMMVLTLPSALRAATTSDALATLSPEANSKESISAAWKRPTSAGLPAKSQAFPPLSWRESNEESSLACRTKRTPSLLAATSTSAHPAPPARAARKASIVLGG